MEWIWLAIIVFFIELIFRAKFFSHPVKKK